MAIVPLPGMRLWPLMVLAWRDAGRALRAMPGAAICLLVVLIVADALQHILISDGPVPMTRTSSILIGWLIGLIVSVVLADYLIRVLRFVILDEVAPHILLEWRDRMSRRFFGTWLVLALMSYGPVIVLGRLTYGYAGAGLDLLLGGLIWAGLIVLAVRLSVLLPAIAIEAPGATWSNAAHDTKGQTWRIFFAVALSGIAFAVVGMAAALLVMTVELSVDAAATSSRGMVVAMFAVASGAIGLMAAVYLAALVSRLFQQIAKSMMRPFGSASPGRRPPTEWPPSGGASPGGGPSGRPPKRAA